MILRLLLLCLPLEMAAQTFTAAEITRWKKTAERITIIRDNWGIPHIYGKTDADAVFGLLYAQCEDDFKRVEMNYIEKLGRLAEVKGASKLYDDLLIRMIIDPKEAQHDYQKSPPWLKKLMDAYADGINYYLYKHPEVQPALLKRFEPWFPLLWTDGSIGAINTADLTAQDLSNLYGNGELSGAREPISEPNEPLTGSNGFAFAPSITASGHAILYINPHVTFYFRPEVHVVSEEGLNVYGAVTWGQFFVYQGFNEHCGWMHTSNYTDIADTYIEKIHLDKKQWYYTYEGKNKPVKQQKISLRYQLPDGSFQQRDIDALFTHHGPVMAKRNNRWLSMKANNRSLNGLIQSWQRTKARSFAEYKKTMDLLANTSNNTVYADKEGNIAYWHGNFLPIRDTQYDWTKPVDGSIAATEWKGLHPVAQSVHIYNPPNGWLQNCNSTPFTAAGTHSPSKAGFPAYMAPDGENFRGINAVRVLQEGNQYTIDKVIAAGYDTRLAAFEILVPALLRAFEHYPTPGDTLYDAIKAPITLLQDWDFRCSEQSVATTLAVEWGQRLIPAIQQAAMPDDEEADYVTRTKFFVETATPRDLMRPLADAVRSLQARFNQWEVPWGEINRFQRISGDLEQAYNDAAPSLPVGFAPATWGMLASYAGRYFPGTQKRYGVNGNSFICAVEFGPRLKAKSLLAGGESGDPASKHFGDQALMYTKGQFKDVLFYKEDILQHIERQYHPGE